MGSQTRVFLIAVLYAPVVALSQPHPGTPQIPFTFVENRGQDAPDVRFAGQGEGFRLLFRKSSVELQKGGDSMVTQFMASSPDSRIETARPGQSHASFFMGSAASEWVSDTAVFQEVCYRGLWKGVDLRFRTNATRPIEEYILASGEAAESIRLLPDGNVTVTDDGGMLVTRRTGTGEMRQRIEEPPHVYRKGPGGESPLAARYRLRSDGTVGISVGSGENRPKTANAVIAFSGYFGDGSQTVITAIAVSSVNNIVVAGYTNGTSLPTTGGARPNYSGGVDAFVAEFSPSGGQLLFCTYLGGSGVDEATAIALDSSNNIYVTGWTSSSNFPVLSAAQPRLSGSRDAFLTKLSSSGNAIIFSTYVGGTGADQGYAIAVDAAGAPVIAGDTTSPGLPLSTGTAGARYGGNQDAFVARFSPSGSLAFMTYLGGTGQDHAAAVAIDSTAAIYVGGSTYSSNFPVQNATQAHSGGGQDGFVSKLSSDGKTFAFSTYYGGSGGSPGAPEEVNALVLVPKNVIVAGTTSSANFPVAGATSQATFGGGLTDGFIGRLNSTTGILTRSTYLGGSGDDGINALAIDFFGDTYVAGYTDSSDFPLRNPLPGSALGGMNAFTAKILATTFAFSTCIGASGGTANALAIDSMTNVIVAGETGSSSIPVIGALEGWPGGQLSSFLTKISPPFTLALDRSSTFLFDVWHDTGYNGSNVNLNSSVFGLPGDIPISGDWDGTGKKRIGVFRNGVWYLDVNGNGVYDNGDLAITFGQAGDLPIVGDWNGAGRIKLGLFRNGTFILDLSGHLSGVSTGLADATFSFGLPGDIPVANDWNQSGTTKVGVFRNGQWLVDYNGDQVFNAADKTYTFGQAGDIPVVGDWDSSGVPKIGVYRGGLWILDYGGYNAFLGAQYTLNIAFGSSAYSPVVL
jgi:hypothetical protein